jgi:predicted homoserine dehydrogenase-like protein
VIEVLTYINIIIKVCTFHSPLRASRIFLYADSSMVHILTHERGHILRTANKDIQANSLGY